MQFWATCRSSIVKLAEKGELTGSHLNPTHRGFRCEILDPHCISRSTEGRSTHTFAHMCNEPLRQEPESREIKPCDPVSESPLYRPSRHFRGSSIQLPSNAAVRGSRGECHGNLLKNLEYTAQTALDRGSLKDSLQVK